MNHTIGISQNKTTVTVKSGDTLTITLPHTEKGLTQSLWTMITFKHHPQLSLQSISSDKGLTTQIYTAAKSGTVTLAMEEHLVHCFPGTGRKRSFDLTVVVA